MVDEIDTSTEAVERLAKKMLSQIGDDVSAVYSHEALFNIGANTLRGLVAERDALRQRAEKAEAKRDEYHAIGNAYAEWAGDIHDLLEGRIGELDPDSPSDQQLRTLIDRAEAGIAAETRRALRHEGDE